MATVLHNPWRFERKFFIDNLGLHHIENEILMHPASFREAYPARTVNSIYFDTNAMKAFRDNVEGVLNRKKTRVRWYGDTFGYVPKPMLEYKIKQGFLGRKEHFQLSPFHINNASGTNKLIETLEATPLPDWVALEIKNLKPKLFNSYERKYYLSADGRFRLTIDTELKFASPDTINQAFGWRKLMRRNAVVELKYSSANDDDKQARNITSTFGFRMTKSSKYVTGVTELSPKSDY
jgi:SPX domain protein involved in polyphosphate accumulation